MSRLVGFLLVVCLLGLALERQAYAYVDPGTGSMLLQLVLGGVAGLAIALRIFGRRILSFFRFGKRSQDTTSSTGSPNHLSGSNSLPGSQEQQ